MINFVILSLKMFCLTVVLSHFHTQLNAWDPKHVDEPAYGTRLEGYSEAKQMLQAPGGWSVNGVLPILHTSMFFSLQVLMTRYHNTPLVRFHG